MCQSFPEAELEDHDLGLGLHPELDTWKWCRWECVIDLLHSLAWNVRQADQVLPC